MLCLRAIFSLTGDHEVAAGSEHSTVASANHPGLKICAFFGTEYSCVWDVWIFLYCIVLDIGSLVPSCDAFVSRVGRGDAISLSVNILGGGFALFFFVFVFFLFSTKFIMKSAKIL